MTTAEMVTRVRSLLDEREAGFWSDAEVLDALNDGQDEVVNYCLFVLAEGEWRESSPSFLRRLKRSRQSSRLLRLISLSRQVLCIFSR